MLQSTVLGVDPTWEWGVRYWACDGGGDRTGLKSFDEALSVFFEIAQGRDWHAGDQVWAATMTRRRRGIIGSRYEPYTFYMNWRTDTGCGWTATRPPWERPAGESGPEPVMSEPQPVGLWVLAGGMAAISAVGSYYFFKRRRRRRR